MRCIGTDTLVMRFKKSNMGEGEKMRDYTQWIVPSIIIGIIIMIIVIMVSDFQKIETIKITVVDKEFTRHGYSGKYLIFTKNEVFQITDSMLRMKFRSSDRYSKLKIGKTYIVDVIGWRVPLFSAYRNIINVKSISGN